MGRRRVRRRRLAASLTFPPPESPSDVQPARHPSLLALCRFQHQDIGLTTLNTLSTGPSMLSFHRQILDEVASPDHDDLLILAKGLGLRRIVCQLMRIYDSPNNLILLVRPFSSI